jgi:hypothetical protein
MALAALNDLAMIKLETKRFGGTEKDTAESGILVALPDAWTHYGMWSFAFEESFMKTELLKKLADYWKTQIGKKVFWTALSERGNIIEKNGEKYAFIKFTSLIAVDDADSDARSVHSDGAGSFGLEK